MAYISRRVLYVMIGVVLLVMGISTISSSVSHTMLRDVNTSSTAHMIGDSSSSDQTTASFKPPLGEAAPKPNLHDDFNSSTRATSLPEKGPGIPGVDICGSKTFSHVRRTPGQGWELQVINLQGGAKPPPCVMDECRIKRIAGSERAVPAAATSPSWAPLPARWSCVAIYCDPSGHPNSECPQSIPRAMCHGEKGSAGGVNVHVLFPEAANGEQKKSHGDGGRGRGRGENVLFFLVDSMSWKDLGRVMPKTWSTVQRLAADAGMDLVSFPHTNALGGQSAINHAAFYTGRVPEKCAYFKMRREGLPTKKDGLFFKQFEEVRRQVLVKDALTEAVPHHFLKHYKAAGYETGIMYPLPYNAWEATCFRIEDEDDGWVKSGGFIDRYFWRFFNSVTYERAWKELNGYTGCTGDRHVLQYIEDLTIEFFNSNRAGATSDKRIFFVAEQTPHQAQWEHSIEYYDSRLSALFERLVREVPTFFEDTLLVIGADHGRSMHKPSRSDLILEMHDVMNPFLAVGVPRNCRRREQYTEMLRQNAKYRVSPFDVYATLVDYLDTDSARSSLKEGHGISLLGTRLEHNRTCTELGILPSACSHYHETPVREPNSVPLLRQMVVEVVAMLNAYVLKNAVSRAHCTPYPAAESARVLSAVERRLESHMAYVTMLVAVSATTHFRVESKPVRTPAGRGLLAPPTSPLRLYNIVRITPYAADERECGDATKGAIEIQFCVCKRH